MRKFPWFLSILLFFHNTVLPAQVVGEKPTIEDTIAVYEDLFGLEEPLNLTLTFDIRNFRKTRTEEKYHPAELTCQVNETFMVSNPVRVKARGNHRRDNCSMPPFWLNIRYAGIRAEQLRSVRRMKVVTSCKKAPVYGDYVLREYLVYKMYNLITPYSFRVRLVKLKCVDTGRDGKETACWSFLIEPDDMMAERLHASVTKSNELAMRTVNQKVMDRLAMFQYMIGNGDYSVTGRHNLKILAMESSGPVGFVPVPYDFDFTGMVNTVYAKPREDLHIGSVRERYYLGPCRSDEELYREAITEMESYRTEMEEMIWAFEYLDEESKLDMIGYIESFFNTAENERFIEREVASTCR